VEVIWVVIKRLSLGPLRGKIARQVWLNPFNPLRTNRKAPKGLQLTLNEFWCIGPVELGPRIKPASGAHRATWVTNNTLNVSRAFLGEPLAHEPAGVYAKRSPWLGILHWLGPQKSRVYVCVFMDSVAAIDYPCAPNIRFADKNHYNEPLSKRTEL
jgi:hypothetical protein